MIAERQFIMCVLCTIVRPSRMLIMIVLYGYFTRLHSSLIVLLDPDLFADMY